MKYEEMIASGLRQLDGVVAFSTAFPASEHTIVCSKHQTDSGWSEGFEWISRASLYDRYIAWLCIPIAVSSNSALIALETPTVHLLALEKVLKSRADHDGPEWKVELGEVDYVDWAQLIQSGEDVGTAAGPITNQPVDRFESFWFDTSPAPMAPIGDGMAL